MGVIEGKLKELDDERKELAEYTQLDKQRRCIEYSLADAELASTRADLSKVNQTLVVAKNPTLVGPISMRSSPRTFWV